MSTERRITSGTASSDGDDGQTEWERHTILESKHRYQSVKVAHLVDWNARNLAQAGIDPPPDCPHQIEVEGPLDPEPRFAHPSAQAGPSVPAHMTELPIQGSEQVQKSGD